MFAGFLLAVAALSSILSTAALDKHPQSKERGITLDLGFSSFTAKAPEAFDAVGFEGVQFTLVDCPGHASLIRTIIGGAQIIDMMILVVDITKGIQTQTAECIVIGEITTQDLVVVLNKIDQVPEPKRERTIAKAKKLVASTLAATAFGGSPIVAVAARPGVGEEGGGQQPALGIPELINTLLGRVRVREKGGSAPFLFNIDHCFGIKGQGTILTGTVARGSVKVNDTIELPELKVEKKVRSMQMFRKPVGSCQEGDRVGICVTQLDPKSMERGVACAPGSVPRFAAAVAAVERVRFYAGEVASRSKLHVTVGHATVLAEVLFFGLPDGQGSPEGEALPAIIDRIRGLSVQQRPSGHTVSGFDDLRDYLYQERLYGLEGRPAPSGFPCGADDETQRAHHGPQWVYLKFSHPVTAPEDSLVIGSRLDADLQAASCRLAFYGRLVRTFSSGEAPQLTSLRVFKPKQREGVVERVEGDGCTTICRGMFKKDTDLSRFQGMLVTVMSTGEQGRIEGGFGKSGKFRVHFPGGITLHPSKQPCTIALKFKKYVFEKDRRRMVQ